MTDSESMKKTELVTPFGAKATIYHQGAHVTSWIPSEALGEQLFVAEQSHYAEGVAIRGGVPVCFPQFAAFGTGVKHGFARNMQWTLREVNTEQTLAVFELKDTAQTRVLWPHAFKLTLSVALTPDSLSLSLQVENTGESEFVFSGALHTYFAATDYRQTKVTGLGQATYWDNGTDLSEKYTDNQATLQLTGALDRVYFDAADQLEFMDGKVTKQIAKSGFTDVVVWNPGPEGAKGLKDMGDEEYSNMLCIEAAIVDKPIPLMAGESWKGAQVISV